LLPFSQKSNLNSFLFSALAVGCAVIIFMIFVSFVIWHHYKKKYASSNLMLLHSAEEGKKDLQNVSPFIVEISAASTSHSPTPHLQNVVSAE
jgi:hypothetical protein